MGALADQLSYEQYLALAESSDDLLEYHDGVVVALVAPSAEHARIVGKIVELLRRPNELGCGALPSGLKVRVEATNRTLIPDVTIACGKLEFSQLDRQALANPVGIIEVLSPGTEDYDQGRKAQQYRRIPSLREYVVVAQDRRFASICRRVGDLWAFEDVEPGGRLKFEGIGVELPLDELYVDMWGAIVE